MAVVLLLLGRQAPDDGAGRCLFDILALEVCGVTGFI